MSTTERPKRVLIAEDEPLILLMLEATFTRQGYQVTVAENLDRAEKALLRDR